MLQHLIVKCYSTRGQEGPSKWGTLMPHEQTQLGSPGASDKMGAHAKLTTGPIALVSWFMTRSTHVHLHRDRLLF